VLPERDIPGPLTVVGRLLGVAAGVATVAFLYIAWSGGGVSAGLAAFVVLLWAIWGAVSGVFRVFADAVAGLFGRAMDGTFLSAIDPAPGITIDDEVAFLERRLAQPIDRHREIQVGVRLAEIYRTHQHDQAKADALLDRLEARYPDAPEIQRARAESRDA